MDAARQAREERKTELLRELAELNIEELVEEGVFLETPHYSVLERAAVMLGRELSCEAQQRAAREVAANCQSQISCPECQGPCDVLTKDRFLTSVDGPVNVSEAVARCPRCRWIFFPAEGSDGAG